MGSLQAQEIADSGLSLQDSLAWHLRANHYPPVPLEMVPVCVEAIEACNDYDYQRQIELPGQVTWRGLTTAPASAIVEAHHLEAWLIEEEE